MNAPTPNAPLVLDAFRLEILSNALNAITEEIQLTLLRSAYSQVVKEAQDASCAIFTAAGRIVAQPVVIPGLGSVTLSDAYSQLTGRLDNVQQVHINSNSNWTLNANNTIGDLAMTGAASPSATKTRSMN